MAMKRDRDSAKGFACELCPDMGRFATEVGLLNHKSGNKRHQLRMANLDREVEPVELESLLRAAATDTSPGGVLNTSSPACVPARDSETRAGCTKP